MSLLVFVCSFWGGAVLIFLFSGAGKCCCSHVSYVCVLFLFGCLFVFDLFLLFVVLLLFVCFNYVCLCLFLFAVFAVACDCCSQPNKQTKSTKQRTNTHKNNNKKQRVLLEGRCVVLSFFVC